MREDGVDRLRFAHALVRDTVYAGLSLSRRGRIHVRVAEVLDGLAGRETEVARHWLAAGPQHAGRAWRAGIPAARAARRVYAHDEAAEVLRSAVEAMAADASATRLDEYTLLMELAAALQSTGDWVGLRKVVHRALTLAEELDDVDRLLGATSMLTTNALWQAGYYGQVDERVIALLRKALDGLPPGDSAARCRGMVSLTSEIYYSSTHLEREALCLEAVAMARRLHDRPLLLWSLLAMSLGVWRPGTAALRLETAAEAAALAEELGDGVGLSTALVLGASAAAELGRVDELGDLVARARRQAVAERHLYGLLVLDGLEIPWHAMRGNLARVEELIAEMTLLHERTSLMQSGDAVMGALLMRIIWGQQEDELRMVMEQLDHVTVMPVESSKAAMMCRVGMVDEARTYLEGASIDLSPHWWFSTMVAALAAEAALHTGLTDLAAEAYEALSDFRGQPACGGSGTSLGPVDGFLAMAACATGERDLATRHADDAARLCEEWRIPLAGRWFDDVRETFGTDVAVNGDFPAPGAGSSPSITDRPSAQA